MTAPADNISVGVAGWSYPDWEGYVYPPGAQDKLALVAAYVDVIEINSSFYRPPTPQMAESWSERTAHLPGFAFTAKLHQDVTHGGRIDPELARAFAEGMAPLRDRGQLRHILAQFRYDFADTPEARAHLARIRERFGDLANLTLELRHASWQEAEALDYLRGLGVTVAVLDYPLAHNSFRLEASGVGAHAYLRLHGRNAKAWFSKGAGRDETYNYLYAPGEIDAIAQRAATIGRMSKTLTLVANNHYQGKEMVAAVELMAKLKGRKVAAPPLLLEKYPRLGAIAVPGPGDAPRAKGKLPHPRPLPQGEGEAFLFPE